MQLSRADDNLEGVLKKKRVPITSLVGIGQRSNGREGQMVYPQLGLSEGSMQGKMVF